MECLKEIHRFWKNKSMWFCHTEVIKQINLIRVGKDAKIVEAAIAQYPASSSE